MGEGSIGRYGLIGVTGVTLDFILYYLLIRIGVFPIIANLVSTLLGISNNFIWNSILNFKTGLNSIRGVKFMSVGLLGLAISTLLLKLLIYIGFNPLEAKWTSIPLVVGAQYLANRVWTFKKLTSQNANAATRWKHTKLPTRSTTHLSSLAILILYVFSIGRIVLEFLRQGYDWDIDHEIYFGQELLRGNLLWMAEFHDKLPALQLIFAIAAAFDDPLAIWRLISFTSAIIAIVCVVQILPQILIKIGCPKNQADKAAVLSGGIYLLVSNSAPGSFTHINVLSASMAIMPTLLGFTLLRQEKKYLRVLCITSIAGLTAAISVSIRPYFIFPLIFGILVIGFLILTEKSLDSDQKLFRISGLLITPILFGVILNLGPYLLIGRTKEFFSGLTFLISTPQAGKSLITYLIYPGPSLQGWMFRLWIGGMLLYSLFLLGQSFRRKRERVISALFPICALLLAGGILTQHFWPHYINLFSWYFSIILSTQLIFLDQKFSHSLPNRFLPHFNPSTFVSFILAGTTILVTLMGVDGRLLREHPSQQLAQALESRFSNLVYSRPFFLAPEDMYLHWKLNESRHGFPHAANTSHIYNGLWADTTGTYVFRKPNNQNAYCQEVKKSAIELIVLSKYSKLNLCFDGAEGTWAREQISLTNAQIYNLWSRKSIPAK